MHNNREEYLRFSGCWEQVFISEDGQEQPIEFGVTTFFNGNTFEVIDKSGMALIKGYFNLDSSAVPKAVDWTDTFGADCGKTFPAIYEISENELLFCAANEDMDRPTAFEAKLGHTIRKFVRISENR